MGPDHSIRGANVTDERRATSAPMIIGKGRRLSRRSVLACTGAALLGRAAPAYGQAVAFRIGSATFKVPGTYLFSEASVPGAAPGGTPQGFSFAFTMPDGAAAGEGVEFPPLSHPMVVDRGGGRYLVMCVDASASGPGARNVSPRAQLANELTDTGRLNYSKIDGMLDLGWSKAAGVDERYVALVSDRDRVGIESFLRRNGEGLFYYGNAEIEKPALTTVIYIPATKVAEARSCLNKMVELLKSWES